MTNTEALNVWPGALPAAELAEDAPRKSDHELARLAAGGNEGAFEELYRLHHRRVYSLCLRMTQNPAEAEDLNDVGVPQRGEQPELARGHLRIGLLPVGIEPTHHDIAARPIGRLDAHGVHTG